MSIPANSVDFTHYRGHRLAHVAHPNPSATRLPLVFVHGLTGSVRFWELAMPPEVSRQHAWYALSLPLHYPSTYSGELNDDALNETSFAEMMDHQITQLIPSGKFIIAGYSVGGFAALNYAAKFPERVAGVVSIGGFMSGRARGLEGVLQYFAKGRVLRSLLFWLGWKVLQADVFFLRQAVRLYAKKDRQLLAYPALEPTLRLIFPDVARHRVDFMRAWFRYLLGMNLLDETGRVRCPVLVFAGDADPVIPFAHQRAYADALEKATFVRMPGVGHVPFAEAPQLFETELLDWLEKVASN